MKGDYYRYLAEVAVADAKAGQSKAAFLHCVFLPVVFVFLFLMQKKSIKYFPGNCLLSIQRYLIMTQPSTGADNNTADSFFVNVNFWTVC